MDDNIQVDKEKKEMIYQKEMKRPEERTAEISPERIRRMKKAFKSTWLQDQINAIGKNQPDKKD